MTAIQIWRYLETTDQIALTRAAGRAQHFLVECSPTVLPAPARANGTRHGSRTLSLLALNPDSTFPVHTRVLGALTPSSLPEPMLEPARAVCWHGFVDLLWRGQV